MNIAELHSLDSLTLPVRIASPHTEGLVFTNAVARELMRAPCFLLLRKDIFPTHVQNDLTMYLSDLRNHHDIVGILMVCHEGKIITMACRLSIRSLPESGNVILFEGIETPAS